MKLAALLILILLATGCRRAAHQVTKAVRAVDDATDTIEDVKDAADAVTGKDKK